MQRLYAYGFLFWLRIESDPLPSLTNLSGKPCEEAKLLSRLHFVGGQSAVAVHIQLIEDLLAGIQEFRIAAQPVAIGIPAFEQPGMAGAHGGHLLFAR